MTQNQNQQVTYFLVVGATWIAAVAMRVFSGDGWGEDVGRGIMWWATGLFHAPGVLRIFGLRLTTATLHKER